MALKRNERYPNRFDAPDAAHPQGAFKNRTTDVAQDGSYLERDWANDWDGFFAKLLNSAGIVPNGGVDSALASQYYDALVAVVRSTGGDLYLPLAGGDVGYLDNAGHYHIKPGSWEGAGGFASQYTNPVAPFLVPYGYIAPKDVSSYGPIVKGVIQTASYGYGTAISFGAYTPGSATHASAAIHVIGDNGISLAWLFNSPDGSFDCPGGMSAQGPIYESDQRVYSPNNPPPAQDLSGYMRGDGSRTAGFVSDNANDPYMRHTRTDEVVILARRDWASSNFLTGVRLSGRTTISTGGENNAPPGCVFVMIGDFGAENGFGAYSAVQQCINGNWFTIESV